MPLSAAAASLLGAGLGAVGNVASNLIGNSGSRRSQKRANRYNIEFWNMQNQYNHPAAQMQRLQEAGLNPNLIYGTSPTSATGNAGAIAPSKAAPYRFDNPVIGMQLYADTKQKEAQTDNLKSQNDVIEAEAVVKAIEAGIKGNQFAKTKEEAKAAKELVKTSVDAAKENVKNIQLRNQNQEVANIVQDRTKMAQISRITNDARKAASELKGQKLINRLRELEIDLKKIGIERTDNFLFRVLGRQWNFISKEFKKLEEFTPQK